MPGLCLSKCGKSISWINACLARAASAKPVRLGLNLVPVHAWHSSLQCLTGGKHLHLQFAIATGSALLTDKQKMWRDLLRLATYLKPIRLAQRPGPRLRVGTHAFRAVPFPILEVQTCQLFRTLAFCNVTLVYPAVSRYGSLKAFRAGAFPCVYQASST